MADHPAPVSKPGLATHVVLAVAAVAIRTATWLPARWAAALGVALGQAWHTLIPIRRSVARANIAAALGLSAREARELCARAYRHYGRSLLEMLRAAGGRPAPVDLVGLEHLAAALAEGRGVLVLSAHLGAFERLVRAAAQLEVAVHVVTRRFRSAAAQAVWRRLRRDGPAFLPAGASARAVVQALARNEVVVFVLDQHAPPGRAVWVPFFGRPAATDPDLARLARRTGAPVVPVFTHRAGARHVVAVQPALHLPPTRDEAALVEATAQLAAVVEAAIRAHPDQWLWIHRRWKAPPPDVAAALRDGRAPRRRRLRAASAGSRKAQ